MTSCSSQTPFAWPLSARQYARSLSLSQLFKFAEPLLRELGGGQAMMKRHSAIEPAIGHMNMDGKLSRNPPKVRWAMRCMR